MPSTRSTAHIFRQFGAAAVVALLAIGGMFVAFQPAGAGVPNALLLGLLPCQDDPTQKTGEGDDKKSEATEQKKPAINKDVRNIKELELPAPVVNELMRGSRPHRDPVPELLIEEHKIAREPTPEEMRKFAELKKPRGDPKTKDDLELIDAVVKYQVYSLTDPRWYQPNVDARKSALERMRRNRDEIEKTLDAKTNENFMSTYRQSAKKYLAELLGNNLRVRINAMLLLGVVNDEDTIRTFVGQIEDPKQHESIKFLAVEGIESLARKRLISNVQLESLAVASLLNILRQGDQIHPFTRQAAVRALGAIGRPTRVIGRNDADVAVALLKILRDPNIRRVDRKDAVVALAHLQIPPDLDYNFQYVTYEIALYAADVGAAAALNPSIDDLLSHLFLVEAAFALAPDTKTAKLSVAVSAKKHSMASRQGDPAYVRLFGEQIYRLTAEALKVYKPEMVAGKAAAVVKEKDLVKRNQEIKEGLKGGFTTQLTALNNLIKDKPPRSMQLTPNTDELGPPPALVGPGAPVTKDAEENGKEKAGDKAAASTNSPGQ